MPEIVKGLVGAVPGEIAHRAVLGVFAEFETNLRKERQMEGIAKAKAAGVYKGRPATIDPVRIKHLMVEGFIAGRP